MLYHTTAVILLTTVRWTRGAYFDIFYDEQKEFVKTLKCVGQISNARVEAAMLKVSRMLYAHRSLYEHYPISVRTSYFDPANMQALALNNLSSYLVEGNRVLDIASGSGYLAACMAYMINKSGLVVAQFSTQEEVNNATANVEKNNPELLKEKVIKFVVGDYSLGVPEDGPYDVIHVGDILKEIPGAILQQLKPGGRLMIPIDDGENFKIFLCDKHADGMITKFANITLPFDGFNETKEIEPTYVEK